MENCCLEMLLEAAVEPFFLVSASRLVPFEVKTDLQFQRNSSLLLTSKACDRRTKGKKSQSSPRLKEDASIPQIFGVEHLVPVGIELHIKYVIENTRESSDAINLMSAK